MEDGKWESAGKYDHFAIYHSPSRPVCFGGLASPAAAVQGEADPQGDEPGGDDRDRPPGAVEPVAPGGDVIERKPDGAAVVQPERDHWETSPV